MSGWPIRYRDGVWQVRLAEFEPVEEKSTRFWLICRCEDDALWISASLESSSAVLEDDLQGNDVASRLDSTAELLRTYSLHDQADWLNECAKRARGEPCRFDGMLFD